MAEKIHIGVVSRLTSGTIDKELAQEARKRGHRYEQIVFDTVNITKVEKTFEALHLLDYDVLYYRTSLGIVWARALQRYLLHSGRRAINLRAVELPFLGDKSLQTLAVATAGIRTPVTVLDATQSHDAIVEEVGTPFVAKANNSAQGRDVHLIHTEEEFKVLLKERQHTDYLYQEYVAHEYDCRIHLVAGKPVAGYRRMKMINDFRCNVSLGAEMMPLSEADKTALFPLAEQVADLLKLDLHVVDFLRSKESGEYYFVEINDNPGWGLSDKDATGVDMSALVIDYFERVAAEHKRDK